MLYYRIPAGLDGRAVVSAGAYCGKVKRYLIGGELYTAKECVRYGISTAGLEPVTISQRRTFTNFGVGMEVHAGYFLASCFSFGFSLRCLRRPSDATRTL